MPKDRPALPVANDDDTVLEIAAMMAANRSPLVAVLDGNGKHAAAARRGEHLRPAGSPAARDRSRRLAVACRSPPRVAHLLGPAGPQDRPGARADLPRCPLRARLRQPLRAAGRHRAQRADDRQAGQRRPADPVRGLPRRAGDGRRRAREARGDHRPAGLLPGQDRVAAQAERRAGRAARRRGAAPAQGPRRAARRRPQDRERRARQRVRHPRHHRRHPLRPARRAGSAGPRRPTRSRPSTPWGRCSPRRTG